MISYYIYNHFNFEAEITFVAQVGMDMQTAATVYYDSTLQLLAIGNMHRLVW